VYNVTEYINFFTKYIGTWQVESPRFNGGIHYMKDSNQETNQIKKHGCMKQIKLHLVYKKKTY